MAIKAIAFDIDGTLYPDAALHRRILPFALRNVRFLIALSAARKELHRHAGQVRSVREAPTGLASFRSRQAELIAARLGWPVERAASLADKTVYGELEERFTGLPVYEGLRDALRSLSAAGFRLAALSDFPAVRKLDRLGLSEWFEIARSSEEYGLLKPAPEPFLALAAELGLKPAEILYVGNSRAYDLAGAKAAGMPVAIISRRTVPGADFSFRRWPELVRFALSMRE